MLKWNRHLAIQLVSRRVPPIFRTFLPQGAKPEGYPVLDVRMSVRGGVVAGVAGVVVEGIFLQYPQLDRGGPAAGPHDKFMSVKFVTAGNTQAARKNSAHSITSITEYNYQY